jgi:hypothetical protein
MRSLLQLCLVVIISGLGLGVLNLYIDGRIGVGLLICAIGGVAIFAMLTVSALRDK